MKKVVITGENSFIGAYFKSSTTDIEVSEIDTVNIKVEEMSFTGVDVVFHVAAIVHQDKGTPDDLYFSVNRDLAFQVARKAKADGVKQFVFMSTVKVYGENTTVDNPWTENSTCDPQDAYGKSKLEAEMLLKELVSEVFKVAVIRTPVVYGVGVKGNIARMANFVNRNRLIPFGGINNKRAMVYVGNLVALIQVVIIQEVSGVFLASDNKLIGTSDFVKCLIKASRSHKYLLKVPHIVQFSVKIVWPSLYRRLFGSMLIDNTQTRERLHFKPPFEIQRGFDELFQSIKK